MRRADCGGSAATPVVYLKMIMVDFFEASSGRGITARCADSMSIRAFVINELYEETLEHSSLTVIRLRLLVKTL